MKNKYEVDETFISCTCGNEILRITYCPEENYDNVIDVGIYSLTDRWSLYNKLRCIWRILIHGSPFSDQIILEKDQVERLVEILNAYLGGKYNE